jgi:hypothetical protein
MDNSFLRRGGLWVLGQGVLMLAVAVLSPTHHSVPRHAVMLVGGVLLLSVAAICGIAAPSCGTPSCLADELRFLEAATRCPLRI